MLTPLSSSAEPASVQVGHPGMIAAPLQGAKNWKNHWSRRGLIKSTGIFRCILNPGAPSGVDKRCDIGCPRCSVDFIDCVGRYFVKGARWYMNINHSCSKSFFWMMSGKVPSTATRSWHAVSERHYWRCSLRKLRQALIILVNCCQMWRETWGIVSLMPSQWNHIEAKNQIEHRCVMTRIPPPGPG